MEKMTQSKQKFDFIYNPKLDIKEPVLYVPLNYLSATEKAEYFLEANKIAAEIPSKIQQLDKQYMQLHDELAGNDEHFFDLFEEMNQISEKICELNVLYLRIEGHFIQRDGAL